MSLGSTNLIFIFNKKDIEQNVLLRDLVGKGSRDPLASHVVCAGGRGELKDSSLSIVSSRDDLK